MISSKRSTGKKKKWHCTLRNLGPKDSNKITRNIKNVKPARDTRVCTLC